MREECVIPRPLGEIPYSERELEALRRLCRLDFHPSDEAPHAPAAVAICPKIRSSNPGIDVHLVPPDSTPDAFERTQCRKAVRRAGEQIASFKQSITCSYTPSILAYYQLSRLFEGAGRVPPSVIRTISKSSHRELVDQAVATTRARYAPGTLIRTAWEGDWVQAHENPAGAAGRPFPPGVRASWLFGAEHRVIYGALMASRYYRDYTEVSGEYDYGTRYQSFKRQPPYRRLTDPRPVAEILGPEVGERIAGLVQLDDVADMIVLDVLLSQQDRVGNIHYRRRWYSLGDHGLRISKASPGDDVSGAGAGLEVREMVLLDNDCGVVKANLARSHRWLEAVAHLSPTTYHRLQWLDRRVAAGEMETYFRRELLFTAADFARFADNVRHAAELTAERCRSGELRLDLDLSLVLAADEDEANQEDEEDEDDEEGASGRGCDLPAGYRPAP